MFNRVRPLRLEPLEPRRMLSLSALTSNLLADGLLDGEQATFSQSRAPAVAMDADGESVAVWATEAQAGYVCEVHARRFDASGTPQGDAFMVNNVTRGEQTLPSVAMDDDGDFVVTWSSFDQDGSLYGVYARRYNAVGEAEGDEFRVNQFTSGNQNFSAVAMDADGDFVVTWTSSDQDGDRTGIFGRRYDASGSPLGNEFQVNITTAGNQRYSTVAMDEVGNFLVTWTSQDQDGSSGGVFARYYRVDGTAVGGEYRVNSTTEGNQLFSSVALDAGGSIIAWQGYDALRSTWDVYAQLFDMDGVPVGTEMVLAEGRSPAVSKGPGGEFIVAWETYDPARIAPVELRVAHLDYLAVVDGPVLEISNAVGGKQSGASVATDSDRAILLWTNDTLGPDGQDVDARLFEVTAASPRNHAPWLDPIDDQTLDEGTALVLSATATDPDDPAAVVSFSLGIGSPEGAQIDPTTGHFSWTPAESQGPGTYAITVRATDDGTPSLTGATTFTVTVNEVNLSPVLDPIDDQTVDEEDTLTLSVTATDLDLPADTLTFSLGAAAPEGAAIDPVDGTFTWTPTELQGPGTYAIEVIVADDNDPAATDAKLFNVVVNEVNRPPVLETIADQTIDLGETVSVTAVGRDSDEPPGVLTFGLGESVPEGVQIDPTTGELTWTPSVEQGVGVYEIEVSVSDSELSDTTTFSVTVEAAMLDSIADQTVDEETLLSITLTATAPYVFGAGLTLSLEEGVPEGLALDSGTAVLTWTPAEGQGPGIYPITVRAVDDTDPAMYDLETFTITVNEVNLSPVLDPIEDQTVDEEATLTLSVTAVDPDVPANSLTFSLDAGPDGASVDPTSGEFTWTPSEEQGSVTYDVTIRVDDGGDPTLGDTVSFQITVNEVNRPPTFEPVLDQTVERGETLSLGLVATDPDLPADTLTFTLDTAPDGAQLDPITGEFTWVTDVATTPGMHAVTARVTDGGAPEFEDTVSFTVEIEDPLIEPIADVTVDEGETVTIVIGPTPPAALAELTVTLLGAPTAVQYDALTGTLSWTTTEADGPGEYPITIFAADVVDPSRIDTETFTVTVNEVNEPPVIDDEGIEDPTIEPGDTVSMTIVATDSDEPDGGLVYTLDTAPDGATIDSETGEFRWETSPDQPDGIYPVTVRVTDNADSPEDGLSDTVSFSIVVDDGVGGVVVAMRLCPIVCRVVSEGQTLTFRPFLLELDPLDASLVFSLDAGAPSGASIDPNTGEFTWTPTEQQGGPRYTVTILATDATDPGMTTSIAFPIKVDEHNEAPQLGAISDQTLAPGETLLVQAAAVDVDEPADQLAYTLEPGAPDGMTIDPTSGTLGWTPDAAQAPGDYSVSIRVTDDGWPRRSDTASFVVQLAEPTEAASPPVPDAVLFDLYWAVQYQQSREPSESTPTQDLPAVAVDLLMLNG